MTESTPAARPPETAHARRVMRVAQAFTELPGTVHGPAELAAAAHLDTALVHRILRSGLSGSTFVEAAPGRYRLGPGAARVGIHAMATVPGPRTARPVLDRLGRLLDAFAVLWVLSPYGGPSKTHAASAPGRYGFDALGLTPAQLVEIGQSLRAGASGHAIAAHLPRPLIAAVLTAPVPAGAGPGVPRGAAGFTAALERVRRTGYAVTREEIPGWDALAAPVLWGGTVYGAVTVLKPSPLMPRDLSLLVTATTAAAEQLSLRVSGTDPASPPPPRSPRRTEDRPATPYGTTDW
ncbi:IclR family transcriptional regulator [Streptomyces cinereoruber]|uniref:IclR family transcriptional regulator n=1 Tax=Streptomyces cinereoruber TaxID=67260 RepID=UPI0036350AC8